MIDIETRSYPTSVAVGFGRIFYGAQGRVYFSQVIIDDFEGSLTNIMGLPMEAVREMLEQLASSGILNGECTFAAQ